MINYQDSKMPEAGPTQIPHRIPSGKAWPVHQSVPRLLHRNFLHSRALNCITYTDIRMSVELLSLDIAWISCPIKAVTIHQSTSL